MKLHEAKKVVWEEINPPLGRLVMASAIICCCAKKVTIDDYVQCLVRGNNTESTRISRFNIINEDAALALYRKTKRPRKNLVPYEDFITDVDDWIKYLTENGYKLKHHKIGKKK